MKLIFGYDNNGGLDRVSPELQAKGVNLLKCIPSEFPANGLTKYPQLGYATYTYFLPAFMFANDVQKKIPLQAEGYPLKITFDNCFSLNLPKISATFTKVNKEAIEALKETTTVEDISVKGRGTGYLFAATPGTLGKVLRLEPDTRAYAPVNSVGVGEYTSLVTVVRIFSSFFRTHIYPSYGNPEDFNPKETEITESGKRTHTEVQNSNAGVPLSSKRRAVEDNGIQLSVAVDPDSIAEEVTLNYAKPTRDDGILPWGSTSNLPNTFGIVCPFVPDLASWDKDMVPQVIERYFLRCLGTSTNHCLHAYSKLTQDWKKSIHKTDIGNILTHMAKVIMIAIPAQARPFPVIEDKQYLGMYLSGACFSVGIRGSLVQPVSAEDNSSDFKLFGGHRSSLKQAILTIAVKDDEDDVDDFELIMSSKTMREFERRMLESYTLTSSDSLDCLRHLNFEQSYLTISLDNVKRVCEMIKAREFPDDLPMHYSAFGSNDPFKLGLAAFGPAPPSPKIPGAPKIRLNNKIPADKDLPRNLLFRKCSLDIAVADWKEVLEHAITNNDPQNLNARYMNIKVQGNENKRNWFSLMKGMSEWMISTLANSDIVANSANVVQLEEEDIEGGGVGLGGF